MKILLISHTCFSTYNNMGKTFLSLFSGFSKEELCQLYIYPSLPDVDVCDSYYRVTDKEIRSSIVRFQSPGGVINKESIPIGCAAPFENSKDAAIYKQKGNTSATVRLLRDAMWRISHWYTQSLRQWLEEEKPTCIFVAPAYAKFIYDIALKISVDYNIPIVTYICDDYYFVKKPDTWSGRIQLNLLRKKMDRLMGRTSHLITICEEIKQRYLQRFGVPTTVIMTGASILSDARREATQMPSGISYFGNIVCNRYISLAEIGTELDAMNEAMGTEYRLNIYTPETNPEMLKCLQKCKSVRLCGFVSGEAFAKAIRESDFLLHTEAFDEDSVDLVKHSVSTKIADSLASGIPLIAYGPAEISSMKHLIRNECALAATSREELRAVLATAFSDRAACARVVENARQVAALHHDCGRNGSMLKNILNDYGVRNA